MCYEYHAVKPVISRRPKAFFHKVQELKNVFRGEANLPNTWGSFHLCLPHDAGNAELEGCRTDGPCGP